jgi:hypothetical protein
MIFFNFNKSRAVNLFCIVAGLQSIVLDCTAVSTVLFMDGSTVTVGGTTLLRTVKSTEEVRGCNIAEDSCLHQLRCKNIKSRLVRLFLEHGENSTTVKNEVPRSYLY